VNDAGQDALSDALHDLATECGATACIIAAPDGEVLASAGDTSGLDTSALASVGAEKIATTEGLANVIGEKEFSILFHEGRDDNIHVSILGPGCALVVVFDDRASLGAVRLKVRSALAGLESLLPAGSIDAPASAASSSGGADSGAPAAAYLDVPKTTEEPS
jgi:predicted regulator of Ras-like GTPase activity (Roadblock/LC7/MglB family)